jgi:hypothetical protein
MSKILPLCLPQIKALHFSRTHKKVDGDSHDYLFGHIEIQRKLLIEQLQAPSYHFCDGQLHASYMDRKRYDIIVVE